MLTNNVVENEFWACWGYTWNTAHCNICAFFWWCGVEENRVEGLSISLKEQLLDFLMIVIWLRMDESIYCYLSEIYLDNPLILMSTEFQLLLRVSLLFRDICIEKGKLFIQLWLAWEIKWTFWSFEETSHDNPLPTFEKWNFCYEVISFCFGFMLSSNDKPSLLMYWVVLVEVWNVVDYFEIKCMTCGRLFRTICMIDVLGFSWSFEDRCNLPSLICWLLPVVSFLPNFCVLSTFVRWACDFLYTM